MKKRIVIGIAMFIFLGIAYTASVKFFPPEYLPTDDEIALHIQLDIKEDIGLIVFDYQTENHEYSGGISNVDKSLIKRDSDIVQVWNKQDLNSSSDAVEMSMKFRIITDYVEPNYENIYPEELTRYADSISWKAYFGESYFVTITGDKHTGYKAVLNR